MRFNVSPPKTNGSACRNFLVMCKLFHKWPKPGPATIRRLRRLPQWRDFQFVRDAAGGVH